MLWPVHTSWAVVCQPTASVWCPPLCWKYCQNKALFTMKRGEAHEKGLGSNAPGLLSTSSSNCCFLYSTTQNCFCALHRSWTIKLIVKIMSSIVQWWKPLGTELQYRRQGISHHCSLPRVIGLSCWQVDVLKDVVFHLSPQCLWECFLPVQVKTRDILTQHPYKAKVMPATLGFQSP